MERNKPAHSILSNGLPFELVAAKALVEAGLTPRGPYLYQKIFRNEVSDLSIDNVASTFDEDKKRSFKLLIECKYSYDNPWSFSLVITLFIITGRKHGKLDRVPSQPLLIIE